jgi:methylmalonyl-CoA mutase, C-terminal domain
MRTGAIPTAIQVPMWRRERSTFTPSAAEAVAEPWLGRRGPATTLPVTANDAGQAGQRAGGGHFMSSIRVVIAKPGLDGHDRGAKVVARALRDAGVEVIYTGLHQTPEQIVAAALQEDADAIGLSVLSGAHMTQFARVLELLKERGAADIVVFGGGIIPDTDIAELERMGVAKIFTPGAPTTDIVNWVRRTLGNRTEAPST